MFFSISLYIALIIFALGLIYKISTWFTRRIGISAKDILPYERISAAVKGMLGVIFSANILILIQVFVLDVVLQRRILKEDFLRWLRKRLPMKAPPI